MVLIAFFGLLKLIFLFVMLILVPLLTIQIFCQIKECRRFLFGFALLVEVIQTIVHFLDVFPRVRNMKIGSFQRAHAFADFRSAGMQFTAFHLAG